MWDLIVSVSDHCLSFYFRILKHIGLNERPQHRIDAFSDALYRQTIDVQKLKDVQNAINIGEPKYLQDQNFPNKVKTVLRRPLNNETN